MTLLRRGQSPRVVWSWAAVLGFVVGGVLLFLNSVWEELPGLVLVAILVVAVFVPFISVLIGVLATLVYWRNVESRVRAIGLLVFGVTLIATFFGVSQLQLRGLL